MKCLNPLNNLFHCLANGGGVGQNVHLNQCCRKFDEMPKSTKHFFHCLANGGSKCSPEPKLQEIRKMLKSTKNISLFGQ